MVSQIYLELKQFASQYRKSKRSRNLDLIWFLNDLQLNVAVLFSLFHCFNVMEFMPKFTVCTFSRSCTRLKRKKSENVVYLLGLVSGLGDRVIFCTLRTGLMVFFSLAFSHAASFVLLLSVDNGK